MRESEFRTIVVSMLRPVCAFSVESVVGSGTPDVCTTLGWIELKIGEFPRRAESPVKVGMRESQRSWHARWRAFGGRSFTLCSIGAVWCLHDGYWSARSLDLASRQVMSQAAIRWWTERPTQDQLVSALYEKLEDIPLR